ncbi:hypothetical protein niasHS_016870 [Heterodera schachtii]|uniref:Uncharacterized protein n=1 Tax=Heterodera schachtii TaxID=97005 RepID=A0ABD2HTI9_HETSC
MGKISFKTVRYFDGTGKPGHCGASSQVALTRTKRDDFLYKAEKYGTLQNYEQLMDCLTAERLPISARMQSIISIYAPASFTTADRMSTRRPTRQLSDLGLNGLSMRGSTGSYKTATETNGE